jgi:hypothetical protein
MMVKSCGATVPALVSVGLLVGLSTAAHALQPDPAEWDKLKVCEKQICSMAVKKPASGPDLSCRVAKTWTKDQIKDGVKKKKIISWSLGDAQCTLDVKLGRATLVDALSKPDHVVQFDKHVVKCVVERDGTQSPVNITLAPTITFKDGQAIKAVLHVKDVEAPGVIKAAVLTVAGLEDSIGIFHKDMLKGINGFLGQKCKAVMGQ